MDKSLQVVQATLGTFHSFDLAAQLLARNYLLRIYSSFPQRRLRREGIPERFVETFPWIHTPAFLAERYGLLHVTRQLRLSVRVQTTFDRWVARRIPECDALIALSGTALVTARRVRERGGVVFCDRGSTHVLWQHRILVDEHARWGLTYPFDQRLIDRELRAYEEADFITVPSRLAKRTFAAHGVPSEKVFVIPYGVRLDRFKPAGEPPPNSFEVLAVGSFSLQKGSPYLLQAFASVRHPKKRLRVVGHLQPEMKRLLPGLPTEHVEFLGSVPQAELPALFSSSHVMVLASLQEGLALVQGQALACGCPVIATAATGAEDLFTDGVEGFILPNAEPAPLAERMQQLADDAALRQRFSEAGLQRVKSLGGWDAYGDLWEALLKEKVAGREN